jgi:hypothetical protein
MRATTGAAAVAIAAVLATWALEREPTPAAADADERTFSGERAQAQRQELLGDGAPHPAGSPANDGVRERLIGAFERQGYIATTEERWACGRYGACARTRNVIAAAPGAGAGSPIVVAAHYDSVAAGPGACDDGAGVATALEIARALRQGPPLERPVRFVITDGEEPGLVGASAYAAAHGEPAAAVVNVEARGTHGLSLLFETEPESGASIGLVASSVPRPKTSSLLSAVYRLLPNDTDFTVLRQGAARGANLAFIEGATRYHTALDDVAHGSVGSLQHEGDTALALVRAFARAGPASASDEQLVWFDLASRVLIRWPARLSTPFGAVGLLLLATAMARVRRLPHGWSGRSLAVSLAAAIGAPIASAIAGAALGAVLFFTGRAPAPWVAHSWPAFAATVAISSAITFALGGLVRESWASFCSAWLVWGVLALASSSALPGGSYLFVPPVVTAGVAGLAASFGRGARVWMLAPFAIVAVEWASVLLLLPAAVGMVALPAYGLVASLLALPVVALLPVVRRARRRLTFDCLATGGVLCAVAVAMPPFSPDSPQRLNVLYVKDDRAGARWLLDTSWAGFRYGTPPAAMLGAADFAREPIAPEPFWSARMLAAPAPDDGLPAPELVMVARHDTGSGRSARLLLRSARGARDITLALPPSVALVGAKVEQAQLPRQHRVLQRLAYAGWQPITLLGVPPGGIELEIELGTKDPVEAVLLDRSPGLPPEGQAIERARPERSQPYQDGDVTLVVTRVSL